jgi:Flp pilus assembly protein TadG
VAAIEFAFVAPVLLMIAFGIVTFSIYLTTWLGVAQAAAEGARASVAGLGASERESLAAGRIAAVLGGYSPLLDPAKAQVTYPAAATGLFSVRVAYPVAELNLAAMSPFAPAPSLSPTRTATVTTGGY